MTFTDVRRDVHRDAAVAVDVAVDGVAVAGLRAGLGRSVAGLDHAVDALAASMRGDVLGWALDEEVAEALLAMVTLTRRLEALTGDLAARLAGGNAFAESGFRTPTTWLQGRTNESLAGAKRVFEHAQWLDTVPVMGAAWREGAVSVGHVKALVEAHARFPRLSAGLHGMEDQLTDLARDLDPKTFARTLLATLHRIDPDAVDEADSKRRRRDVGLHVSTLLDGFVRVDGLLTPELGQQLLNALASARDKARATAAEDADNPNVPQQVQRRLSALNVDALAFILDAAASATGEARLPDVGGVRPVVHITIDSESLIREGASAPGWITSLTGQQLTPITAASARRLACDSIRQILLLDPRGHLDAISRPQRVIPLPMRTAITTRDAGQCRFPGCHHAIREIHHIVYWQHGGTTTTDNLTGLCTHHHHQIHDRGWTLTGNPNQQLTFTNPHGHTWHSDPPRRQ